MLSLLKCLGNTTFRLLYPVSCALSSPPISLIYLCVCREELVVYPAFERHIPSTGHDMAEKDRSEHRIVKEKLYDFQSMSPSDSNFLPTIDSLWQVLSQHIREEERDDLPALEEHVDAGTSDSLARSFDRTKHFVPTRSHPSAPDRPPYETAAGMLATPMDKLMDMFRKFPEA